jgi:alkylation response protein AidB-like acyl-CoA dehydrogenase
MVAWMIDTYGADAQRQEWLPMLTSMQGFGSYCLTEPGAGSDAAAIATSAIRSGDEYVLTGVKQFISGGGEASVYIVMARTDPSTGSGTSGARGITAFLVPADTPGPRSGSSSTRWAGTPSRRGR